MIIARKPWFHCLCVNVVVVFLFFIIIGVVIFVVSILVITIIGKNGNHDSDVGGSCEYTYQKRKIQILNLNNLIHNFHMSILYLCFFVLIIIVGVVIVYFLVGYYFHEGGCSDYHKIQKYIYP